ncbi:MAG: C10 family peptidase [Bacteroidales bacterium]|nr:C10 family peptidase [Bacteroidales bacterium]
MKNFLLFRAFLLMVLFTAVSSGIMAEPVSPLLAEQAAHYALARYKPEPSFRPAEVSMHYDRKGDLLFYVFILDPQGYIVVSGDTDLPPVIAYSFASGFSGEQPEPDMLEKLLVRDMSLRKANIHLLPEEMIQQRHVSWQEIAEEVSGKEVGREFQQWPEPGTTTTGGWIETLWKQTSPYNMYCPLDPVTWNRSLAGCPAVAMGMIIDYHRTIHNTSFSDPDDYYHNYSGRQYWIDDDYEYTDFPPFPALNELLETLESHYVNQVPLTNSDQAALIFACGVAAHQVYTSSISGTFGLQYAHQGFLKFQFEDATLIWAEDTTVYTRLSENIKNALPAQISVRDEANTMGHNVIVDGYNTDDYYHVNFGWGGSYNGWYLLPQEFPYGLTVLKGVIVDIGLFQGITLDLKVFLEGPFNGTGMNSFLNAWLPLNQPFSSLPWNYPGTESVSFIPNQDIVDWILVELRETTGGAQNASLSTRIARQAGFLLNNGSVVALDGTSPLHFPVTVTQELYALIWHRNHLGILSAYDLTGNNGVYNYDFSSAASQVYGGPLACRFLDESLWGMIGGDGNADGQVNNLDKNGVWGQQAGQSGYLPGDFNLDVQVNNNDKLEIWAPASGMACQVPN